MENISNMSKEEVIASIQSAIQLFQRDVLSRGFFDEPEIDFKDEEHENLKNRLKKLVIKLKDFKDKDVALYESIVQEVENIEPFTCRIEELTVLQKWIGLSVISDKTDDNARKLAELMKSTPVFDFINRKKKEITNEDLRLFGDAAPYVQLLWKQVKQEELLGLLIYVNSGKAAQDYKKMNELNLTKVEVQESFLYSKFQSSFHNLRLKDGEAIFTNKEERKKVSAAYYLDYGVIINDESKELHFGFATANFDTTEQKKQFFEVMRALKNIVTNPSSKIYGYELKPLYITNSIVNENDVGNHTEVQKPFLKTFEKELTKADRNILNKSSFFAMLGNLTSSDNMNGLNILDIVKVNPFVSGADTLSEYENFRMIEKTFDQSEYGNSAAILLRNFMMYNAEKLMDTLEKVAVQGLSDEPMHHIHGTVCKHFQNIMKASMYNFASHLTKQEYLSDNFVNRAENLMARYDSVYSDRFLGQEPSKNIGISNFLNTDVVQSMEKNWVRVANIKEKRNEFLSSEGVAALNIQLKERELAKSLIEISTVVEEITPLLREIPELKEKDIESLKEAIIQAHTKVMLKPALQNYKDVLNSTESFDAPEAVMWVKRIKVWEKKEDLRGAALVKKELVSQIFANVKDPVLLKEVIQEYHASTIEEIAKVKNKRGM